MSGKRKQAHRTKGNAKPSSSCRAAELLAASGGTTSGFVGFGSFSGDLGYVPATTAGNDDVDSAIDADFRLVLRKLSKKDSTTKLKALQEFAALCKEKEMDEVKLVLPYWPRIYSRVAIDNDRRVREAAQQAFEQLVLRVRRSLAPHLKSIMGSWLVSQCDSHALAASAAKAAFQNAFPPAKQTEALVFCKNEILAHIQDNLFTQTVQSLSDPKTTSAEDMEAKYQKLIASTLMALRLFIETVPPSQQESLYPQYRCILGNAKLWKMAKHSSELIQGAFYSLLAAVCNGLPEVANEFSDKICPVVLHNLDKTDPIVCPALWEAALNVITNIQDCWSRVNARKGVLPKLWVLLRQGGGGSAYAVYPSLLPFLSHVPAEVVGPGTAFYQEFFGNMKEGLAAERVQLSPSECAAVIQAFIECLRYIFSQHLNDLDTSHDITSYLLQDQLLPLVKASLVDKSSALAASPLFSLVVELVTYLHKTMTSSDESSTSAAKKAFIAFWDSFSSMSVSLVESDVPEHTLQRLATLLKSFRNPMQCVNKRKSGKVRFADDDVKSSSMTVPEKAAMAGILPPAYGDIFEPMPEIMKDGSDAFDLVCKLCQDSCINTCKKHVSVSRIQFLASLARSYMCDSLMHTLLAQHGITDIPRTAPQLEIVLTFVQRLLLPWLRSCDDIADVTSRTSVIDSLIDIFFSVFGVCSSAGDRVKMLTTLLQDIQSAVVLSVLVQRVRGISHDAAVHQWFRGDEFGERMVAITTRLCESSLRSAELCGGEVEVSEEMDACWTLLCFALSATEKNEPQISTDYIDKILVEIRTALPTPDHLNQSTPDDIHRCVSFVCDITHSFFVNIQGCVVTQSAEELLLALFRLSCQHCILSENLVQRVSATWQQGVAALIRQCSGYLGDGSFLVQAVSLVNSLLQQDVDTVDKLLRLYDDTLTLARCVNMSLAADTDMTPDLTNPLVKELLRPLCIPLTHHKTSQITHGDTPQCLSGPLITGQLTFSSCGETHKHPDSPSHLHKHLTTTAFSSLLLVAMQPVAKEAVAMTTTHGDEEAPSGDAGSQTCDVDESLLMDVAYCIAFSRAVLCRQTQALETSEMGKLLKLLETNFSRLFETMSPEHTKTLVQHAINRSLDDGHLWSLAMQVVLERLHRRNLGLDLLALKGSMDRFADVTESSLHTLQALLPHLPLEDISHVAEIRAAQLLTCPSEGLLTITGGLGFLSVYRVALSLLSDVSPDDAMSTHTLLSIETLLSLSSDVSAIHSALCDTEWAVLSYNIELMRLIRAVISLRPATLSPRDWDVILCRAVSMVQMCEGAVTSLLSDMATATFVTEACHLVTSIATCMQMVVPHHPDAFPPEILTEWTELFSASIYSVLLPMFNKLSGGQTFELPGAAQDVVIKAVSSAVALCPLPHLMKHQMALLLVAEDDTNLPDEIQTLMNHFCPLLLSPTRTIQLAAYSMLMSLMPSLPGFDEGKRKEDEKGEGSRSPPMALMNVLDMSSHAVELVLQECDIGETAIITPFSEEHTYSMAYLLSWKLLLNFFKSASSELRSEFAQHLQQMGAVDRLLLDLFRLLPHNPEVTPRRLPERATDSKNMFVDEPTLAISGNTCVDELARLACAVYFHVLEDLPAIMRQWWNSQDKRVASIVDRYTSHYVSPLLCAQEMRAVQDKDTVLTNMTVKVRPVTREVVALYMVEEITMELVVTLPVNHPLGPISVECGRRVGVANTQWRNWMLQMITFLSHQNGSILDGLFLWKRSVDKRFEGVEDCMVCFSVIHGTNYQLPRLQCRTCKKKFHSACLYKWFSTSNKSTCPLCRNLF